MTHESRLPLPHAPNSVALRLLRLAEDQSVRVLTLSACYGGLLTHYHKKRSCYCSGEDCPAYLHAINPTWKGYFSGLAWDQGAGKWIPWVVEMTEWCELDLRDRYARGQVWEFSRKDKEGKGKKPLTARLVESRDSRELPTAFDYRPVLLHVYHQQKISLETPNPMPARAVVEIPELAAPFKEIGKMPAEKRMDHSEWERLRREAEVAKPIGQRFLNGENGAH